MTVVLGLDASTTACSAAVLADGRVVARRFEEMERGQAERLNPMIGEVMAEAGVGFGALDLVAVTTGPGAFTGLRIGLACARALTLATGVPLAGVTTFRALAHAVPDDERGDGRALVVCVNGKRRDVFVQRFAEDGSELDAPGALAPQDAPAFFAKDSFLLAGDGVAQLVAALGAEAGPGPGHRIRLSHALAPPDAAHVAMLAAAAGPDAVPPRPFYIRPPDARLPGARSPKARLPGARSANTRLPGASGRS